MLGLEPRVVLGAQGFQGAHYARRGIGRYARCYVNALCADWPDLVERIDTDPDLPLPAGLDPSGRPVTPAGELAVPPADSEHALVYHVLAPFQPWPLRRLWPRWARDADVALAVTLYDLIPLRHPERYLVDRAHSEYVPRLALLHAADALLAISEAAAADAVELLGIDERRVHVVGAASPTRVGASRNGASRNGGSSAMLPPGARPGGILFVSGQDWRKNTERMIDAYAALGEPLRDAHALTIVGGGSERWLSELVAHASARGVADDVVITGEISDSQLEALRESSSIAVSPSLDEGFGLPVLEALEAGLPTFVSDIPSHRSLVLDADARFDPTSTDAIERALERALTDAELRERVHTAGPTWAAPFSWTQVAKRGAAVYDAAAAERERRRGVRRRRPAVARQRLSIVTPWPPSPTGVGAYSARLVQALAPHVSLDVYVEAEAPANGTPQARLLPARRFDWHRELTPSTLPPLFCIGNSCFHLRAWQLLMRHRGDVLLHDVRLVGLYSVLAAKGLLGWGTLGSRLRQIEGVAPADLLVPEVLMVGEVVDRARRIYVHTRMAREMVLSKRPDRADDVFVVPFALPPASEAPVGREAALIVSVGYQHAADLILDAVTPILRADPSARLVCAGPEADPGGLERLRAIARERGVGERTEFRGWVDEREYRGLLERATVALQLRSFSHGEMSASVADCLAAGVPTIVNDRGAYREFADDALLRLVRRPAPEAVTASLRHLLANPGARAALSAAALRHTRANGADRAAESLLARIRER